MTTSGIRQYWDACVIIAIFNAEAGRVDECVRLFHDAERGKFQIVTATLTLAEGAGGSKVIDAEKEFTIRRYFEHPAITLIALDRTLAERARDVQRQCADTFNLKIGVHDAIHIATAIRAGAAMLCTCDAGLMRFDKLFKLDDGRELRIAQPQWTGNLELPLPPT